jgi:hypothetical protein
VTYYLFIPLFIIAGLAVLFGIVVLLGRFRKGRYLRPIIATLSKLPWLRRQFQKVSEAAIERQNPELASAMRKLQRVGSNPNPQQAQQALSQLTATERRAYLDAVGEQGPEPINRQQRRLQQRLQQGTKRPASNAKRGGKRR